MAGYIHGSLSGSVYLYFKPLSVVNTKQKYLEFPEFYFTRIPPGS